MISYMQPVRTVRVADWTPSVVIAFFFVGNGANCEKIREEDIVNFIDSLELSEKIKKELKQINPTNYTGKS